MSVFIKSMKMPIDCKTCAFLEWEEKFCLAHARLSADGFNVLDMNCANIESGSRHPECPLVEVQEPHGRLIDADEFYKDINESAFLTDGFKWTFNLWFSEQNTVIEEEESING